MSAAASDCVPSASVTDLRRSASPVISKLGCESLGGISVAQLKNYLTAKSVPSVFPIARMCAAAGYSLEWVVSGVGPEMTGRPGRLKPGSAGEAAYVGNSPAATELAKAESPDFARMQDRKSTGLPYFFGPAGALHTVQNA